MPGTSGTTPTSAGVGMGAAFADNAAQVSGATVPCRIVIGGRSPFLTIRFPSRSLMTLVPRASTGAAVVIGTSIGAPLFRSRLAERRGGTIHQAAHDG